MKRRLIPLALLTAILGVAMMTRASAAPAMSVQIVSPVGQVTIPEGGQIHLKLHITGLTLNPSAMGKKSVAGQGHYHFYVDCIPSNGYSVANLGGCWSGAAATPDVTFDLTKSPRKVSVGTHVLLIALARNDHVLYPVPPASILFTVTRSPMRINIVSPRGTVTVKPNGKIPLVLKVSGIRLNMNAMGRKNVSGEGHYHFYVDCITANAYQTGLLSGCWAYSAVGLHTSFDLSLSHFKIKPGTHMLLVALARNDHILYRVPAANLIFTVKAK